MRRAGDTLLLVALLCVCAALLYLDWRRQGEVELLNERVDKVQGALAQLVEPRVVVPDDAGSSPVRPSVVDRILHASDDRTLADIARGNA